MGPLLKPNTPAFKLLFASRLGLVFLVTPRTDYFQTFTINTHLNRINLTT